MPNHKGILRISQLREQIDQLNQQLEQIIREDLPVGTEVSYEHGANEVMVIVDEHIRTGHWMWVRNRRSGKRYQLHVSRITGAWRQ